MSGRWKFVDEISPDLPGLRMRHYGDHGFAAGLSAFC